MLRYYLIVAVLMYVAPAWAQLPPGLIRTDSILPNLFIVKKDGKMGVYDTQTNFYTVSLQYDKIEGLNSILPDFMLCWKDGKCGLIDPFGYELIKPTYQRINSFHQIGEGFAVVEKNGLLGLIDATGTEAFPCKFDRIETFDTYLPGFARVQKDGLWGLISYEATVLEPIYETLGMFGELHPEYALIKTKGRCGLIDASGFIIIPCEYDTIEAFGIIGTNIALVSKKAKYGVITSGGYVVIPCQYDVIERMEENVLRAVTKGSKVFYNFEGIEVEYED